ncbi:MAG: hypothetical protein ABSF26_14895 [Thermoguttaceae bacterium]
MASETRIDTAHAAGMADRRVGLPILAAPAGQGERPDGPQLPTAGATDQQVRIQTAQLAEHLWARQTDLDHREAELNARTAQLDRDLSAARLWLAQRVGEIEDRHRAIQRRSAKVDRSLSALERLRRELGRRHREALETRLATEELWAQLRSGHAAPEALDRSLGRIRARLAEQYHEANAELQERKEDIERLQGQVAEQYKRLLRQKRELEQWLAGCRREMERESARAAARRQEFDYRERELAERSKEWPESLLACPGVSGKMGPLPGTEGDRHIFRPQRPENEPVPAPIQADSPACDGSNCSIGSSMSSSAS